MPLQLIDSAPGALRAACTPCAVHQTAPYSGRRALKCSTRSRRCIMCWYSADLADEILQAEAGQRLGIRKLYQSSWIVRESDLRTQRPTPVCLIDRTTVLFRFSEAQQLN